MPFRSLILSLAAVLALAGTAGAQSPAPPPAGGSGSVGGSVANAVSRGALAGAQVELLSGDRPIATQLSGPTGAFQFAGVAPGTYAVRASAASLQPGVSAPFTVAAGQTLTLDVELQPVAATNLVTIGRVGVAGGAPVSNSSASSVTITSAQFAQQGINQVQEALDRQPGITIERYDNASPGAVATLTIRGAGGFVGASNTGYEVLVLQDGEPLRNGQYGDFDLSSLTPSIYQRAEVIKGVGGTSIFGANTIGGTLNLVTKDPYQNPSGRAMIGAGTYGLGEFDALASDTIGKLGFLFDAHQYGTSGAVPAGFTADFSSECPGNLTAPAVCALAQPTQTINLKSALEKIRYDFSPVTSLTLSAAQESDYRDQVGLLSNPTLLFAGNNAFANDPLGYPYFFGFPGDYVWNIQPKYTGSFHTQVGGGDLILRYYNSTLERVVDGLGEPPQGCCFLSRSVDRLTGGEVLFSRAFGNHALTFGYGANGDNYFSGSAFSNDTGIVFNAIANNAVGTQLERTYLIRDDFQASPRLTLSAATYYSDYDTLNVKRLDPRFGIVYRPDALTAARFSVGTGFGAPTIKDITQTLDLNVNDGTSSPQCPQNNPFCVASIGNPNLKGESATGFDLGFDRAFLQSGIFSADVYRTNVYGHLFTGEFPAPAGLLFSDGKTPVLFIDQTVNLAGTVYTGLELSAKVPVVVPELRLGGYYNTQAAYPSGVPATTEALLGNVVNGQQYQGVPLHKYGYGLDYQSRDRRSSAFFSGTFYGDNNAYNLPSFWLWDAGVSVALGQVTLHLTDSNVFNKNAFLFANFGGGVPYSGLTGPYSTNGIPVYPHTIELSIERRFGDYR